MHSIELRRIDVCDVSCSRMGESARLCEGSPGVGVGEGEGEGEDEGEG